MALRPLLRPWTPGDDERVRGFVANGISIVRAGAALNRKQVSVRDRAKKLGCPFPTLEAARKKLFGSFDATWRHR
jgi:hypothetical protein